MTNNVTGETEAKAILKGKLRQLKDIGDSIFKKRMDPDYNNTKRSNKVVIGYHKDSLSWYGDFLVTNYKFKSFGSAAGSSKHFRYEYTAIEPEIIDAEDIGGLCRFVVNFFDSRKYTKQKPGANQAFVSQFYFHEHFLIRCIQRLNERAIGEIGASIYPVIEYFIMNNLELKRVDDVNYFVFRDFILVSEKLPNSKGVVFKTILLTEQLRANDQLKFESALDELNKTEVTRVEAVMTNPKGEVVRHIPPASGASLLNSLKQETFWLQHIYKAQDIRGDQVNIDELLSKLSQ